jgi:hypothetical protein
VVDEVMDRPPCVVKHLEVEKPSGALVDRPEDGDLDAKTVTVEPRALVTRRHARKAMGRLEAKLVHQPNFHGTAMTAFAMYIVLSKQPRKVNRKKSKRYRAQLKAKDKARRNRVYGVK